MSDYGLCPICGAEGISRERRPNGNDRCINRHKYPSREAIKMTDTTPEQPSTEELISEYRSYCGYYPDSVESARVQELGGIIVDRLEQLQRQHKILKMSREITKEYSGTFDKLYVSELKDKIESLQARVKELEEELAFWKDDNNG